MECGSERIFCALSTTGWRVISRHGGCFRPANVDTLAGNSLIREIIVGGELLIETGWLLVNIFC